MKHTVDGHDYTTEESPEGYDLHDSTGAKVATAQLSPCREYIYFFEAGEEHGSQYSQYHINNLHDSIPVSLAQWFSCTY